MWFKNLMIYRLTKPLDWALDKLQSALEECEFHPCHAQDQSKFGWVSPLKGAETLYFSDGRQILLTAQKEEKILPSNVVKRELDERIAAFEEKEGRKASKIEKQSFKDDVVLNLLPRAFSKIQQTSLWIDPENALVYVNAASAKRAEDALALLRKSLGSLPVIPLAFANEPAQVLTHWVADNAMPHWLEALEEAELRGVQEDSRISCKKQPLENEEILALLQDKKVISKLALDWEDTLSFVFHEDGSVKRLKFADAVREKNEDILKEDYAQRFDADFVLMTGILSKLTENLLEEFGGEKLGLGQ